MVTVDLEYPDELHDAHNDYPLAPEKLEITEDMLCDYNIDYNTKHNRKHCKTVKLIGHLGPRKNYTVHVSTLALYQELGMRVTKIHEILHFVQMPWMRSWIEQNTKLRQQAASAGQKFKADVFKLANNACYGKLMEDIMKHMDCKLETDPRKLQKRINHPCFQHAIVIDPGNDEFNPLTKVLMSKGVLRWQQPVIAGACVLDFAKETMYDCY